MHPSSVVTTRHRVTARDGTELAATLFAPATDSGRTVIINAAMGVPQRFFASFALYLAASGLTTVTWDYRGIGESAPKRLRGYAADIITWAQCDLAGIIDWVAVRDPNTRLLAIGQSLGGQIITLAENHLRIAALMLVSCPSGYWGHWPTPARYAMWSLATLGLPVGASILGYFPARRLRLGEDLPAGVAREWGRWIRHPEYLAGNPVYRAKMAALAIPIRAYSFADDRYAPRTAIDAMLANYSEAAIDHRHLDPRTLGVERIGHHGFFRKHSGGSLWADATSWLSSI
jgi:predicted alpha/beta hydrolase